MLIKLASAPAVPKMARATIFLAFFGNGFLMTSWVVHIPRIKGLLGLSDGELGLCLWAGTLGLFLGMTLGGWIVERYRSQFVTGIATVCLGVPTILAVLSHSRLALVLSLVPFGFFNGLLVAVALILTLLLTRAGLGVRGNSKTKAPRGALTKR